MEELVKQISDKMAATATDMEKSVAGNKSAGARARKSMSELTKLFKEYRKISVEAAKQ